MLSNRAIKGHTFVREDFSGCSFANMVFEDCLFLWCDFRKALLFNCGFFNCSLQQCDLTKEQHEALLKTSGVPDNNLMN